MSTTITIPAGLPTKYDNTWGASLIGGFVTAVLYGVLMVQIYIFFQRSKGEMPFLRVSMVFLWVLNTMHIICILHSLYIFMVSNFLNPLVLIEKAPWSLPMVVFFTTTTDVLVQCWFTFRVYRLSKGNRWLTAILATASMAVLADSIVITVRFFQLGSFPEYAKANWIVFLGLGLTVATDLVIALALCYYLRQLRQGTIRRTNNMVGGLMVYAVNTGLLTSLLCVACLIARLAQPNNFIFIGLFFPLSSLYSNAFLGSLNARDWFRKNRDALTIPLGSMSTGSARNHRTPPMNFPLDADTYKEDPNMATGTQLNVQVKTDVVKATL